MLDEINYQIPGQYFKKQKKILNSDNIERAKEREREVKGERERLCFKLCNCCYIKRIQTLIINHQKKCLKETRKK